MAMYVLVEFDEDQEAKDFIADVEKLGVPKVRGMYKKPTQFCDCPPEVVKEKSTNGRGERLTSRGKKYGWWVHLCCKKPPLIMSQMPNNLHDNGETRMRWRIIIDPWNVNSPNQSLDGWGNKA